MVPSITCIGDDYKVKSFLPAFNGYDFPFHTKLPDVPCGSVRLMFHFAPFFTYEAATFPFGCGISPCALVSVPRCGSTFIFLNPGASLSMPSTMRYNSILGLDPHAWQSDLLVLTSDISPHVV